MQGERRAFKRSLKCASTWIEPIETWDRCSTIVDFPSFLMEKSIARNTIFPTAYSLDKLWMIKLWTHYFYSTTHYLPHKQIITKFAILAFHNGKQIERKNCNVPL